MKAPATFKKMSSVILKNLSEDRRSIPMSEEDQEYLRSVGTAPGQIREDIDELLAALKDALTEGQDYNKDRATYERLNKKYS